MHCIDTKKASASGVYPPVSLPDDVNMLYIPNPFLRPKRRSRVGRKVHAASLLVPSWVLRTNEGRGKFSYLGLQSS